MRKRFNLNYHTLLFTKKATICCFQTVFFLVLFLLSDDSISHFHRAELTITPAKDFTIIIHSCNKTKWRLNKYLSRYIINKPHIHIYIVYPEGVTPDPRYKSIVCTGCGDHRMSLDCRNVQAYNFFIEHSNLGDFLYRAMDDTLLNITNLEKLIYQLRTIYDPNKHIIFKGFLNDELNRKFFLGGGSGWLMSRAMVKLHKIPFYSFQANIKHSWAIQDDTTETIIVRKIGFKSSKNYIDPRWAESGSMEGNLTEFSNGNFENMKVCNLENNLVPIHEMIALHSVHEGQKNMWIASISFPSFVYCFKRKNSQIVDMCKYDKKIVNKRLSFNYLKENAEIISLSDIIKKNLSVWNYSLNYIEYY